MTTSRKLLACLLLSTAAGLQAQTALGAESTVSLDGIERVHLLGGFQLTLKQGEEEYVTIRADSDDIDKIEARIKGDTLALASKRDYFGGWLDDLDEDDVSFEVQLRSLRHLSNRGSGSVTILPFRSDSEVQLNIHGSGEIVAKELAAPRLELKVMGSGSARLDELETRYLELGIHGSGDVEIDRLIGKAEAVELSGYGSGDIHIGAGDTAALEISLHGSGDVDVGRLRSEAAEVTINGSGDVELHAVRELKVRVHGSGDVSYRGQPRVDKTIRGSGDVRPRD